MMRCLECGHVDEDDKTFQAVYRDADGEYVVDECPKCGSCKVVAVDPDNDPRVELG